MRQRTAPVCATATQTTTARASAMATPISTSVLSVLEVAPTGIQTSAPTAVGTAARLQTTKRCGIVRARARPLRSTIDVENALVRLQFHPVLFMTTINDNDDHRQ